MTFKNTRICEWCKKPIEPKSGARLFRKTTKGMDKIWYHSGFCHRQAEMEIASAYEKLFGKER